MFPLGAAAEQRADPLCAKLARVALKLKRVDDCVFVAAHDAPVFECVE